MNVAAKMLIMDPALKPEQLQAVSNMIRIPNIVSAHPSTGLKSIPELIAFLKANPDKLNYSSSGIGRSILSSGSSCMNVKQSKMLRKTRSRVYLTTARMGTACRTKRFMSGERR